MKILLVYPEMPDTFYALKHFTYVIGRKAAFPPLGLLTVAAMLPEKWERKLVDLNVTTLTKKDLQWADLVFLSAMNVQENSVKEIIQQCNESNVKIVAGGPLFTHEHDRFEGIDYFVLNEAELTLKPFLDDLEKGEPKMLYKSSEFADVSKTPVPQFELVDMSNYLYSIIQYSRGCPYLCDFCDVTALFGRKPRTKSVKQIIAELDEIRKNKDVQLVLFADDNLIGNKRELKTEMLSALIEWRKRTQPGFYFATQLTINLADDVELMKLLLDAGFRNVFIGIESPDESSLKVSHKNQNLKRNLLQTINYIQNAGFIISGGFIVGFDTDTQDSFDLQARFIQMSGIPLPIVNILKAPPGTELFERIKKEGRLVKHFAFSEGDTNLRPTMGIDDLQKGFLDLISKIYKPENSLERLKNFYKQYSYPKGALRIKMPIRPSNIIVGLRLLVIVCIFDKDRLQYWNFIGWILKNKRKYFDHSLIYVIMMYQMKKGYETIVKDVQKDMASRNIKVQSSI